MTTLAEDIARAKRQGQPGYDVFGDPAQPSYTERPSPSGPVRDYGANPPPNTSSDEDFPNLDPALQGGAAGRGLPGGELYVPPGGGYMGGEPVKPAFSEEQAQTALDLGIPRSEWGDYFNDPTYRFTNKQGQEIKGKMAGASTNKINRTIISPYSQNTLSGSSTVSGGTDTRTDAERERDAYLEGIGKPKTEEEILKEKTDRAQGRIRANEDYYAGLLQDRAKVNQMKERETNAQLVLQGLSGSTEAGYKTENTLNENTQANARIREAKQVALSNIYADIQDQVDEELRNEKDDYTKSLDERIKIQDDREKKAVDNVTLLAKSGFDFEAIKANDPTTYNQLSQSVGGEAKLKAYVTINRPEETIEDKRVENGQYIIAYRNPTTGKLRIEKVDLGLPDSFDQVQDLGDKKMFYPKGHPEKAVFISKGIAPRTTTQTEEKNNVVDQYSTAFSPGVKLADGTPTLSPDGYATFGAWKEAIKEAPTKGLTRANFIKTFGHLLLVQKDKIPKEYGLTPAEERLVLTAKPAEETLTNPFE